jgi:hypothetical protein
MVRRIDLGWACGILPEIVDFQKRYFPTNDSHYALGKYYHSMAYRYEPYLRLTIMVTGLVETVERSLLYYIRSRREPFYKKMLCRRGLSWLRSPNTDHSEVFNIYHTSNGLMKQKTPAHFSFSNPDVCFCYIFEDEFTNLTSFN